MSWHMYIMFRGSAHCSRKLRRSAKLFWRFKEIKSDTHRFLISCVPIACVRGAGYCMSVSIMLACPELNDSSFAVGVVSNCFHNPPHLAVFTAEKCNIMKFKTVDRSRGQIKCRPDQLHIMETAITITSTQKHRNTEHDRFSGAQTVSPAECQTRMPDSGENARPQGMPDGRMPDRLAFS